MELEGRFGLRRFVQAAGVLSLVSIASFVRAVVTAKLFAVTLGPSTVGILVQVLNFSAFVSVIIPLGLTTGVVKMVAADSSVQRQVSRVILTASVLALASALAAAALLAPAAGVISIALTGSSQYTVLILLIIASLPLYNLSGVIGYVLQGLTEIQRLTRANVITAAFSVIVLIPLTIAYGLTGAVVGVLITSMAQAIAFGFELWRAYASRAWRFAEARFDRRVASELLAYGGVLLVGGVLTWGSVIVVRTIALRTLGDAANGLYQVVFGLSTQYITIFMTWMAAYVFPRVVSESRSGKLGQLLNSGLRANLAIMVPILVIAIALRDPLIRIFYSSEFGPAAPLIPIQVLGDYARIVGWSFAVCLFAIGHTRSHLALMAAQSIAWVILAAALIPMWGITAVPISYTISYLTFPVFGIALSRYWAGVVPDRIGLLLSGLGLLCVAASGAPFFLGLLFAPIMPAVVYALNRYELRTKEISVKS